jgi:diguanylate cyclase (GGDEF)-like protein
LVIEQLAMALNVTNAYSPSNAKMIEELMLQAQANHPSFFNITRTDKNGSLGFFAPRFYNEQIAKLPKNERTVKDRSYFIDARRELKTVTSEVILSKGVVEQPMISLAAPIFKQLENEQLFDGVMFGAIDLTTLNSYEDDIKAISPYNTVIVTDQKNRIVYSNKASAYKALSKFSYLPSKSQLFESIPLMVATHQSYLYKSKTTEFGWKVYVIQNSQNFTTLVREQFILVGFGLLLVLSAFLYIAYKLTNRITAPLKTLLDNEEAVSSDWLNSSDTSKEFSVMAKKLKRSSYLVKNYESRLKQQVEEKTERLEQRNQALALKARQDGLTKLLNRSGFNELTVTAIKNSFRHHQPFSIALLDLDNFKFINDTYGHPFGDKCLMAFAKHMQHFCKRDTDMIGRYGGEEFIIYLSGTNVESQHELINRIHQETQLIKIEEPKSGEKISFTVSAGVCSVKANKPYSLDELVLRADEALYKCKRNGRNQVSFITID